MSDDMSSMTVDDVAPHTSQERRKEKSQLKRRKVTSAADKRKQKAKAKANHLLRGAK